MSPSGSWLSIGGRKYPLGVHQCEGIGVGVRWVMQDPDTGQRCRWLLLTPDGRVGSRTSLGCRYRSQRIWTRRRQMAHARLRIISKVDPSPLELDWLADNPFYFPPRPKRMGRKVYRRIRRRWMTCCPGSDSTRSSRDLAISRSEGRARRGPKPQPQVRFRGEADMDRQPKPAGSVANCPKQSFWDIAAQEDTDRHWLGERPTNFLNARLNAASDP